MEYEFSMTLTNHRLDPDIEIVFLMADGGVQPTSPAPPLIKQVARFGGADALARFVPAELIEPIMAKIGALRGSGLTARTETAPAGSQSRPRPSGSAARRNRPGSVRKPNPQATVPRSPGGLHLPRDEYMPPRVGSKADDVGRLCFCLIVATAPGVSRVHALELGQRLGQRPVVEEKNSCGRRTH